MRGLLSGVQRKLVRWCALCAVALAAGLPGTAKAQTEEARRYMTYCAGCHGADGQGGERAAALATRLSVMARSDAELFRIVHDGTDGGMPPFGQIGDANIRAVIRYLRTLEGVGAPVDTPVSGDAAAGRTLFFGKAQCATCHTMEGRGGFIARNLTTWARNRTEDTVLQAITAPDKPLDWSSRVATVTTQAGQRLTGVLRYEDNFNVDLQTADGHYHFLAKRDLARVQVTDHSLMPRDYGTRLTAAELNDLAAFLMTTSRSALEP